MTTISDKLTRIYNAKKDIKSAITEKGQSVGDNILDYAAAIRSIEQGSGGSSTYRNWWKVYFIDYDGTVLSYQEVNNGDDFVFPDAPNHADKELVFTGWNQTSNHTTDYDPQDLYTIVIGALYDTVGNTKFYFNVDKYYSKNVSIYLQVFGDITIDWGDGNKTTYNGGGDIKQYTHSYSDTYFGKDVIVELIPYDGVKYDYCGMYDNPNNQINNDFLTPYKIVIGLGCQNIFSAYGIKYGSLKELYIGNTCISIYGHAFDSCYCLQSVSIPSSVTYIGSGAFYNCYCLQSVTIPSSVTSISGCVFENCYSLKSVSIPSSVTSIFDGSNAFKNCYSIYIYNTVLASYTNINSIYNNIHLDTYKCNYPYINSITIPDGTTSIGESAFQNCSSLQSVTIPSSVTSIVNYAFQNCYSLQSVTIPSGVTSINYGVFSNCYGLQSVTIPSSVTNIDGNVLENCYGLQSVTIPSSVTSISGGVFSNCYSLQSVTIPSGVTSIGNSTFMYCKSLQSVTIPSSVTSIDWYAFHECSSLKSVTIPSSVTSISGYAFGETNCTLDFGNERTTVPTIESTESIGYNLCIVPDALYDQWCAATNWSAMTEKIIKYSDFHK